MSSDYDKLRSLMNSMKPARRALLMEFTEGREPEYSDVMAVSRFTRALAKVVGSRRVSVFRGLGRFEWRPWKGRTPDGTRGRFYSLVFQLTRSARNYRGRPAEKGGETVMATKKTDKKTDVKAAKKGGKAIAKAAKGGKSCGKCKK